MCTVSVGAGGGVWVLVVSFLSCAAGGGSWVNAGGTSLEIPLSFNSQPARWVNMSARPGPVLAGVLLSLLKRSRPTR